MTDILSLSLSSIIPHSIIHDEQVSALAGALDPQIKDLSGLSSEPLILGRIDELPEQVLDILAWQLHADFYDLAGTISMKRDAVKSSLMWHMHKGTEWAVLEALRQIDISAEFVPWWESGDEPYTFRLKAIVSGDFYRTKGRDKLISSIRRAVEESKAARSYMTGLETEIHFQEDVKIYHGAFPVLSGEKRILPAKPGSPGDAVIYQGTAGIRQGYEVLRPYRETKHTGTIYASGIIMQNIDASYGVDLDTMQELLRQFEKRIFARIDASEIKMLKMIESNHDETNAKLEEIKNMLLWRGQDEEL